jgi:tRNA-specific 2-thiouridylase
VIVDEPGQELGGHGGVHRFPVGQQKGLGLSAPSPLYVIRLEAETGKVVVGPRTALVRRTLTASDVNWISCDPPQTWMPVVAQIRHRHRPASARVRALLDWRVELVFDEPQPAITPGQAVVFYDDDIVVGGGWID